MNACAQTAAARAARTTPGKQASWHDSDSVSAAQLIDPHLVSLLDARLGGWDDVGGAVRSRIPSSRGSYQLNRIYEEECLFLTVFRGDELSLDSRIEKDRDVKVNAFEVRCRVDV